MRVIGLTGGAGTGKSTASAWFRRHFIPVFDADRTVHRLQAKGGAAVAAIERAFPGSTRNGAVDRAALRAAVIGNPPALRVLEQIVHPLVRRASLRFLQRCRRSGRPLAVLDIPLLFETGADCLADITIVMSAPLAVQKHRLRLRGLSAAQIEQLIAHQMPDAAKRRRADIVVQTGLARHHGLRQLKRAMGSLPETPRRRKPRGPHREAH